ncbi:MAG: hypothetical protein U0931_37680 [Vulcanimicrobiota bacterium]
MKVMFLTESENRGNLRVECASEVICDLGARKIPARLLDLSWSGLRLESERPIPAGSLIHLLGGPPVWCICRWCCKSPDGKYWSGHELRDGVLSPRQLWVRKILERNGIPCSRLENRRRVRRYETEISTGEGLIVNLSLFGACLVQPTPRLEREVSLQMRLGSRVVNLQAVCLQTRKLAEGGVAHHLCWENRPAQTRAVAFLLSTEEGRS